MRVGKARLGWVTKQRWLLSLWLAQRRRSSRWAGSDLNQRRGKRRRGDNTHARGTLHKRRQTSLFDDQDAQQSLSCDSTSRNATAPVSYP